MNTEYRRKRKEYRELCEKRKEENDTWDMKIKEAKREADVWEVINRKKRKGVNDAIEMQEWREQFMELLGGVE